MKAMVSVDKVGRLVLPQEMREAIGIFGPTRLEVEAVGNCVLINGPEVPEVAPVRKRGRRVYGGVLPEDWDSGEAVSRIREQRTRR